MFVDADYISISELHAAVRQALGPAVELKSNDPGRSPHSARLHSPMPGAKRVLSVATILSALSLNSDHLGSVSKSIEVCFERRQTAISVEAVLAAMHKALAPRVVRIKLVGIQPTHAPPGAVLMHVGSIEPARNGKPGQANWRGRLI
mgnify:CR=1 FL=1